MKTQPPQPQVGDVYYKSGVRFAVIGLTKTQALLTSSNLIYLEQTPIAHLRSCTLYRREDADEHYLP